MKRFIGFVRKEFYHIFRDRRSLIILFGMPVAQILLFGFAITNEINNVDIAVLDRSRDALSRQIINKIESSKYFKITDRIEDENSIESIFQKGKIKAVIVIGDDFAKRVMTSNNAQIQVVSDATEPNTANTIANYIGSIVRNYQAELNVTSEKQFNIDILARMVYNPELKGVFMFVPGVMTIILLLVSAMMTSISIAKEKEIGTMEVLLVSPLNPFQVILGKVIPYISLSVINAIIILLLGFFVFNMPVNGSIFLLALVTILFIITALALGIFISTVADTQQTAMMISLMGLMLPVILLSGFIFPVESMPWPLQILSNIVPARWFIIIIKGILLKGVGFTVLWKEILILLGMSIFFIALGVRKYKIRLA
jgi:ABC-2 type transport system permease protein